LCSFQVMKIQTRFQMEGISKRTISLEDQKKLLLEGKEMCSTPIGTDLVERLCSCNSTYHSFLMKV